ncbi:MAG: nickel pincer cofactor biosynthesis protein LarB [Mogibacterium sp.]|nr:nickel pincer cofactor biosynthesis protein LarB [Mogibacterium sp.]
MNSNIKEVLKALEEGRIKAEEALERLKIEPFEDIGYAKLDLHRRVRQGSAEVIYGEGKTAEQIIGIVDAMVKKEQEPILVTRLDEKKAAALAEYHKIDYSKEARLAVVGKKPEPDGLGRIVIATGGTSDIPVAEEAAITAETLGNEVVRLYDVGVAGIHRLLANKEYIMNASVIITVAGMEGALASVVGGLADCPIIAVPTSVGYGASFGGLSALLSMLNSCASGVACVNIDNGFGAGYMASRINHMEAKK